MKTVLLVEDSPDIRIVIKAAVGPEVRLEEVSSAAEALAKLKEMPFDLILLDLQLPDQDGFHLCAQVKNAPETKNIPIMIISGNTQTSSKVLGFSLGIEDYIMKPFDPLELRARILAKLKKNGNRVQSQKVLVLHDLVIDMTLQRVFRSVGDGRVDLHLSPIEFRLFCFLANEAGKVLDREKILKGVWGDSPEMSSRVVDRHMSALRKKLGSSGFRLKTLSRHGYGFDIPEPKKKSA